MSHEHHHEHEHHHHHEHGGKKQIIIIAATVVLLIAAAVVEHTVELPVWGLLLVYLVPYLLVGHDTLKEAAEGIFHGNLFNEHFLLSLIHI